MMYFEKEKETCDNESSINIAANIPQKVPTKVPKI